MADMRDMKAIERRKRVVKYLRMRMKQVEMAEKEGVDVTTISEDIQIIRQDNSRALLQNKRLTEKNIEALLDLLAVFDNLDAELWNIYYGKHTKGDGSVVDVDPRTKLAAIEQLRANASKKAELLKILNPTQVVTYNFTYIEKLMPVILQKYVEVIREFVPKEKQIPLLEKLQAIDIEKELEANDK